MATKEFLCTNTDPIVKTKQGKIRGFKSNKMYCFFGIDYAKAERFEEPQPVDAWTGVKDALNYGYVCPLLNQDVADKELLVPHRYWLMDENCLNLNVWTTALDKKAKKPVMVWFHGGGYSAGSSIEHVCYEGDHLAEYGDVVVVSVNHRLNILGYFDLSDFGDEYKNTANLGNMDLVASLQWVHDNIEAFGGDPDNVTIFGQSGGGMKVTALMNTPAADGLFHKGIVESGVGMCHEVGDTKPVVKEMLKQLGKKATVEDLKTISYHKLTKIYQRAVKKLQNVEGIHFGSWPKKNDWYLGDPLTFGFSEHAKTIPVLVGSVMGEFNFERGVEGKYDLTEAQCINLVKKKYGKLTDQLLSEFKKAYPGKNLTDALYIDQYFRIPTKDFIQRRCAEGCVDTFNYMLTYDFPIDGGKVAWHCSEIPFVFHNTDRTALYNVKGETDKLEKQFCDAFVNFAKTAKPSSPSLPEWPVCALDDEKCMIFDKKCKVVSNFDNALLEVVKKTNTALVMPVTSLILPPSDMDVKVVH